MKIICQMFKCYMSNGKRSAWIKETIVLSESSIYWHFKNKTIGMAWNCHMSFNTSTLQKICLYWVNILCSMNVKTCNSTKIYNTMFERLLWCVFLYHHLPAYLCVTTTRDHHYQEAALQSQVSHFAVLVFTKTHPLTPDGSFYVSFFSLSLYLYFSSI